MCEKVGCCVSGEGGDFFFQMNEQMLQFLKGDLCQDRNTLTHSHTRLHVIMYAFQQSTTSTHYTHRKVLELETRF